MEAVPKRSRADNAYEQLKENILSNILPPGFQATEPEFALRLGMSRTPVREALIRLAAEGLVELIPRHGARILPIRADDMREIYEVLISLESDAAAVLARRKLGSSELRELSDSTREMEKALEARDLKAWAEADDRFHRGLLELHGNRRLKAFVRALSDQAHRARIATLRLRNISKKSSQEHRAILKALMDGDAEAARTASRAHRERAVKEILSILDNLSQL